MSLHQEQLVKTKEKTHTQEKQNNNNYDPAEKTARRLWLKTLCIRKLSSHNLAAYYKTNQFVSPLNVVFSTLGTGHMYLLRVLIGSFDCLHLVIGLVLVSDT